MPTQGRETFQWYIQGELSYTKYRMVPEQIIWDDSDDKDDNYFEQDQDDRNRDWDVSKQTRRRLESSLNRKLQEARRKHHNHRYDKEITEGNAKRIMEFPPGMRQDGGGFDMQLSNKVYNKIRIAREGKRKTESRTRMRELWRSRPST